MPVKNRIQLRRGTSAQWSGSVDILASGEMGWDTTENNIKIGDGSNYWDDLPWLIVAGVSGQVINPTVVSGLESIYFDTTVADVDQIQGQLNWNDTFQTLDLALTDTLTTHIGQDVFYSVINLSGGTIYKGQPVYAAGVNAGGQRLQVEKYIADASINEVRYIGLLTETLNNGDTGFVTHFGHVKKVDLRSSNTALNPNAETWAAGDILFPDPLTAGGLTKVPPQDIIYTAIVLADGNNGELLVRITDPGHINDLHDVNTSGLVDNNLMVWNSGAGYWEPTSSMTFNGTTLHTDTDGITAIFGRDNAQTNGGKVRIYVDDADTAGSVQAIKAFNNKTTGTNYGINATANGLGATKNVGLYGWAAQATTNWGLWVNAGDSIFDDRVGINTYSPTYDLHVNGSGYIVNNFDVGGDTTIDGHLAASTKSFLIDHPTKKGKKLQYGSLESPYHGVRLTGKGKTSKGKCVIQLPDYIRELIHDDENINIQITNYKHAKTLYVNDINIKKNNFTVKVGRTRKGEELEFFWSFTAVRKDVPDLIVEK